MGNRLSRQLINEYRAELDRLRAVSGSRRESVLREAFKDLLKRWGRAHDLQFVPEHDIVTAQKSRIYLDGALLHALRVPFGYWEAKDLDDDNIIYSDDHTAVLIQDGQEVERVATDDTDALYALLARFGSATVRRSTGYSISTRKGARAIQLWPRSSTPIALPIIKRA
jgi:hypothetical protein